MPLPRVAGLTANKPKWALLEKRMQQGSGGGHPSRRIPLHKTIQELVATASNPCEDGFRPRLPRDRRGVGGIGIEGEDTLTIRGAELLEQGLHQMMLGFVPLWN